MQMDFIVEIDKLKSVLRQSHVTGDSRRENSAEHSWHLAVMAMILGELANEREMDLFRVVKMVLVHDLVEIDAGDTFVYDEKGYEDKAEREQRAADRLFSLLPAEQGRKLRELWEEFEAGETPEARFANALDRLQPILQNYHTEGRAWKKHGVTKRQVIARNRRIGEGSKALWEYAEALIEHAVENKYLSP
jgi:putative hydrolase of HD superfamily